MGRTQLINWDSPESHVLLNPRLPENLSDQATIERLPTIPAHIWLGSSGTTSTGQLTLYGLSKSAFLTAAEAANKHLEADGSDVWLLTLPVHHVGGLSIWARSFLGGQQVVDQSKDVWSAEKFHKWVNDSKVTLASLVPTQIYDLVQLGKRSPKSLRAIVVGGAALTETLYLQARDLGFPCLPSFGSTETCAQMATAEISSLHGDAYPELRLLSHVEAMVTEDGMLAVRSPALFTARADIKFDHVEVLWRAGEWFVMKDMAELSFDESKPDLVWLHHRGRAGDSIKISGELVNLAELSDLFAKISAGVEASILAVPDSRKGFEICLAVATRYYSQVEAWIQIFNSQVLPVAKIRGVYFMTALPKTDLNKIMVGELKKRIGVE